jgi:hypothetical protein
MKKLAALATTFGYLLTAASVFAGPRQVTVPPNTVPGVDPSTTTTGMLIASALQIVFIFAALAVLVFLVIGAFRWIASGGDKEAIGKARGTIVNALIGLALLALAFFIASLAGEIVGISLFNLPIIPRLGRTTVFPQQP